MLIGYARVSKADGSQSLDLQRDALIASGVEEAQIWRPARRMTDPVWRPASKHCVRGMC
jgi:DNA invertase Pin-like site-specific DNA recombinase